MNNDTKDVKLNARIQETNAYTQQLYTKGNTRNSFFLTKSMKITNKSSK